MALTMPFVWMHNRYARFRGWMNGLQEWERQAILWGLATGTAGPITLGGFGFKWWAESRAARVGFAQGQQPAAALQQPSRRVALAGALPAVPPEAYVGLVFTPGEVWDPPGSSRTKVLRINVSNLSPEV